MAESTPIHCPATLDIAAVAAFHRQLCDALDAGAPLELQAADLERIDTAGLQLLAACCQDAASRRIPVCWASTSDVLHDVAQRLALTDVLQLPERTTS